MEARPDQLYGKSLRLHIPRLEIKNLRIEKILSPSCFSRMPLTLSAPQSEETDRGDELNAALKIHPQFLPNVQANEVIILMINSFVDFFIQYYCPEHKVEHNPLILKLKEIIFYSTNTEPLTAMDYDTLVIKIMDDLKSKWPQWPQWPHSEFYFFPKNVGRQFEYDADYIEYSKTRLKVLTEELRLGPTMPSHRERLQEEVDTINLYLDDKLFIISTTSNYQKFEIFSLLFLSFHILSMSGFFFEIQIQDLDEILREEIKRGKPNSFILQFLPNNHIVINIIKTHLLTFFMTNSICMPALRELRAAETAERGGSKRVHNRSRKNKYKHKYNHKYKKSRKNKRHRRKRTQSNQNKMF
jgi:hypothetical protein